MRNVWDRKIISTLKYKYLGTLVNVWSFVLNAKHIQVNRIRWNRYFNLQTSSISNYLLKLLKCFNIREYR